MPSWQAVDPAEDRSQELVKRGEGQMRLSLSGVDAEGRITSRDR
jgi:hypothetical protein